MKKIICFLLTACHFIYTGNLSAQQWNSYFANAGFAVNTVDILKPGYIVTGGGQVSGDSVQVMFWSSDYGVTWNENPNDGMESWNKSIAFSDTLNGFGVGYQGRIIKTTNGGRSWGNAVFPVNRNLNKIVNVTPLIYYAVGGMKDTVQTIIKTSDGGINWQAVYDTSGPWLESVFFMNALKGFAVGDSGVILSTTNGGSSWSSITAPVQRNFYAITFINADTGYIVGGLSDSIPVRTILQTMNGGASWSVVEDQAGSSCLKDISFADSVNGYIVGDSAVLLKSMNSGQSWSQGTISGGMGVQFFTSVKFSSVNFGVVGSSGGWVYVYTHQLVPTIQTLAAVFTPGDSLALTALVNTYNSPAQVSFIYSTDSTFNTATVTYPSPLTSNTPTEVSVDISSLRNAPGKYYFTCKATSLGITYLGDTLSFVVPSNFPQLTTLHGSGVAPNSITLRGQVSNLLLPANVYFEYQSIYDSSVITVAASPSVVNDTLFHSVTAAISGLLPYTPYQVRLKATSGNAVMYGNYLQFSTTPGSTIVTTLPATNVSVDSATLHGEVAYLPFSAGVWFEYSLLGSGITHTVVATPSSINDAGFYSVSARIGGLLPNSYYQYRIKVSNFTHTVYGDYLYLYNGGAEIIVADTATYVGYTTVTLNGHLSNIRFPANIYFYYNSPGLSEGSALATPAFISDTLSHTVLAGMGALHPFTLYNYALYAVDSPLEIHSVNPASFYTGPGKHNSLILTPEPASNVTSFSATLNGLEANLPVDAAVYFEYWQSGNGPVSIPATPDSITDSLSHQFTVPVTGLNPNTLYLYRIKITGGFGTIYSDSMSFYNGPNTIPNFDFENWTTTNGEKPDNWINFFGPAQKVSPGANGSNYAAKIQSSAEGNCVLIGSAFPAAGGNGVNPGNGTLSLTGGFPYNARPDTLSGMFQYNILSGDTGYVGIIFKSAGQILTQQFMPVTGSSGPAFQQLKFPIHYNSAATPDTLILGFLSSNIYANFPVYGSSITVDNLTFGSSYPPIVNGDFENWTAFTYPKLDNWTTPDMINFGFYANPDSQCVDQTIDAWHGNYAVQLSNFSISGSSGSADMSTNPSPNHGSKANFPLNHRPVMLTGYYQFFPQNGDTLSIEYFVYKNGNPIGGGSFSTNQLVSQYTFFTANCRYNPGNYAIPDSASIEIRTLTGIAGGNFKAIVDYLAFDGFMPTINGLNTLPAAVTPSMRIYPNPAGERFTVEYMSESGRMDYLKIYDLCGKVLYETEVGGQPGKIKKEMDLSQIASGIYLVSIQSGPSIITDKFIIQH